MKAQRQSLLCKIICLISFIQNVQQIKATSSPILMDLDVLFYGFTELSAATLVCFIYSYFCFSPLSSWRQLLHLLLLDLLIHLGGFVEQTLQVAVGALEGGL